MKNKKLCIVLETLSEVGQSNMFVTNMEEPYLPDGVC